MATGWFGEHLMSLCSMKQQVVSVLQCLSFSIDIGQQSTRCFVLDEFLLVEIKHEFGHRESIDHTEDTLGFLQAVTTKFLE